MRVLVTGATGFVGRHSLRPLVEGGSDVHALGRSDHEIDGVTWHRADLLDASSRSSVLKHVRPEALLHLAWSVEPGRFWTDPANLSWVASSLELVRAFADAGGQRLVVAGTCAEYDWTSLGVGICYEATSPCRPRTLYGVAKYSLLNMLAAFANEVGLSLAWGRLFLLFGSHAHPDRLVAAIIRSLLRGQPVKLTHGRQRRDFMDTRDAGAAFARLLLSGHEGIVNVASGKATSIAEVANLIAATIERPDLLQFGALPERHNDPAVLLADTRALREQVGHVSQHSLKSGLADTVTWWRAKLKREVY